MFHNLALKNVMNFIAAFGPTKKTLLNCFCVRLLVLHALHHVLTCAYHTLGGGGLSWRPTLKTGGDQISAYLKDHHSQGRNLSEISAKQSTQPWSTNRCHGGPYTL